MEQHLKQVKQQHAAHVHELQMTMDRQRIQIDDLLAQLQAVQAESQRSKHSAAAASQLVGVIERKYSTAKTDLSTAASERAELQARQQDSDSKVQTLSTAAKLTADREINLQQQISALKQNLASSSNQQDILDWQNKVEQAHRQIAELQQEKQQADAKVMQFNRLKEDLTARKQELARESLRRNEVLSALSHSQTQEKQLQKQLKAHTRTDGQKQSENAMLRQKVSQQQQELALAQEQTAQANKCSEDRQQAAIAYEKQIESIKAIAVAQTASRQQVEQQLASTRVQQQEQADTVCKLVEKLDAASSSMLAKDENIKFLNEQVQQMQALAAKIKAAKQDAKQTQAQLDASTEQVDKKVREITTLRGKVEALQRQQAQVAMLEVALECSKSEVRKHQAKIDALETVLAGKQDDLDTEQAKQKQQQSHAASMQAAMETLERQLDNASDVQRATEQQLAAAQVDVSKYKQQIADMQVLLASSTATQQSSSQSILALQEGVSQQAAALTACEAKCQTLLAELDSKDEQVKQAVAKLHAAEYVAAAAQDAASRLQARLTGQQAEAGDQSKELTEALQVGSITVQQLELTIQALQDKVFAAEHAMESQQEQLSSQQAAASHASQQVEQLAQQLASRDSLISSLQTALATANFVAESNQQLVESLQESSNGKQEDTSVQVKSLVEQLQLQASKNRDLMVELSSTRGKLAAADQAIAAWDEKLVDVRQERDALAARVAFLTKLLERREQREWEYKIQGIGYEMTMHDGATGNPEHPGQPSGPSQSVSAAPAEILQEVAMLQLAPQADGASLQAVIKATGGCASLLSDTTNTTQATGPAVKEIVAQAPEAHISPGDVPGQTVKALDTKQVYTGLGKSVDDKENMLV